MNHSNVDLAIKPDLEDGMPAAAGEHDGPQERAASVRLPGVEQPLPAGEELLWSGRPGVRATAMHVLHLRALLGYWALVGVGFLVWGALGGPSAGSILADLGWLLVVALLGSAVVVGFGWLVHRTSLYAITSRRVVMRTGVTLPGVLNLPVDQIASVDLREWSDGSGDLILTPTGTERVGWLFLWPHVKPWQWRDPIPAFRAVPDAERVGRILARAVSEAA